MKVELNLPLLWFFFLIAICNIANPTFAHSQDSMRLYQKEKVLKKREEIMEDKLRRKNQRILKNTDDKQLENGASNKKMEQDAPSDSMNGFGLGYDKLRHLLQSTANDALVEARLFEYIGQDKGARVRILKHLDIAQDETSPNNHFNKWLLFVGGIVLGMTGMFGVYWFTKRRS
jgi:hypothetical protein